MWAKIGWAAFWVFFHKLVWPQLLDGARLITIVDYSPKYSAKIGVFQCYDNFFNV
jgi:hypothetical protein